MRMCPLLVDLPDVRVTGVQTGGPRVRVHVESTGERPTCEKCGALAWSKGRLETELVDLPCFGNPTRLVWHKRRWACPHGCGSWVEHEPRIGRQDPPRPPGLDPGHRHCRSRQRG